MQIGLVTACTNHTLNSVVHVTKEIHCSWMPLFEPKVFDITTTIMILMIARWLKRRSF